MVGLWPGLWREGKQRGGAWQLRVCCRASRVPGRKGRPQPCLERKGMGTERAEWRLGRGHTRWESAQLPPGRLCPSAPPRAGEQGWGDNALLNLAQNKQPSAAGENSWPVFQPDREMVEPFSSGPVPAGSCSSINPLWWMGVRSLSQDWCWLLGWDGAFPIWFLLWHCRVSCSYCVDHGSP